VAQRQNRAACVAARPINTLIGLAAKTISRAATSPAATDAISYLIVLDNEQCFGVGVARVLWAEDLQQARRIDAIRSETEGHLREQIRTLESQISILRRS
jgi:hypothetical protein